MENHDIKKIIISIIVVLTTMVSFAQNQVIADSSTHLTFKGVPIDGTLSEYVSKMKQNGFTHIGTEGGTAILNGEFAGFKNCIVGVVTLERKNLVSAIHVMFPRRDTWSLLSSDYFSLKEMLTEKYGKPSEYVERFESYSEPKDDGSKMMSVRLDKCKYYTIYNTDKGDIELLIYGGVNGRFVRLSYFDKINGGIAKAKAVDDL